MYSVFGCPGTLLLIIIIIIIIIFVWPQRAACTLLFLMALVWSRAICTVLFLWLPKLGGLNIFCAHVFKRLPLGFSNDVGNRTNVFFVQEHILAKFGALRARSFLSRDRSL